MSRRQRRRHTRANARPRAEASRPGDGDADRSRDGGWRRAPARRAPHGLSVWRRRRRHPRVASVWPCGGHDGTVTSTADVQAAPEWLERAAVRIVTSYTEPGQRVLLIAPPPPRTRRLPRWTTNDRQDRPDPYLDLLDTNWAISRLGRSAQTTLAAHPTDHSEPRGDATFGEWPHAHLDRGQSPDPALSLERAAAWTFDLIVTVAAPHDHAWLAARGWPALLRTRHPRRHHAQ